MVTGIQRRTRQRCESAATVVKDERGSTIFEQVERVTTALVAMRCDRSQRLFRDGYRSLELK